MTEEDAPATDGGAAETPGTAAPDADEVEQLRNRLARARADYENLQRRVERDAALERQRVRASVLADFLQVYEYGKMAEAEAERNPGPLADGVKMVVRQFDQLLERQGARPIGALGEPFDASIHEAVGTEPADGIAPGHVSRVVRPGYRLDDRVLQYAKVAVAPTETEAPGDEGE